MILCPCPGVRLDCYEIVSLLVAGGVGENYEAKDLKLGRDVAIKALPEAFAQNKEGIGKIMAPGPRARPNSFSVHERRSPDFLVEDTRSP